ncbi:class II fumarate hydratase [Streptomyces reniochalinae]|uniref:Fumarate hydratase class II n=1 Tax=Streptomyces reniochalinae TaxID=2250578 RepID=A0A367F5S4_9ACTN|nr:class II fumarate hydratase [Streptomyces reniochalinae]RCG25704.1 class II fumarate hydratase [Streptomyces reniochalinae]
MTGRGHTEGDEAPEVHDVPIGLDAAGTRRETDSMGAVDVPAGRYWGAQTQRSLIHFAIGDDRMPMAVYHAYGHVKKAAAIVNGRTGRLPAWKADLIGRVADEVIAGMLDDHFPLYVWQTGSGTQSNMNTNEVISNRAIQLVGGDLGSKTPIHPNDHVNLGQSSNDTFPTAMHIAAAKTVHEHLLPSVQALHRAIETKAEQWRDVVKIGRTHLEDAVPLTVGQEWSGYAHQLAQALDRVTTSAEALHELAAGGTAVGTGLNAPPGFAGQVAAEIASATGYPFTTATNKFAAQGSLDAMVGASAGLRALAVPLMKIANDIRWLASGPRCGLSELILPANEPGSSIMPGKVNPTQCEAMVMVCLQVLSQDTAIAFAGSQGNFELNAMRPIVISNFLHAATILTDACTNLRRYCIEGVELHREQIDSYVNRSLMLVTALSPVIGYEQASTIAHKADKEGSTLREAALDSGSITAEEFDRAVDPATMVHPAQQDQ